MNYAQEWNYDANWAENLGHKSSQQTKSTNTNV
jgi:hypothetical protein